MESINENAQFNTEYYLQRMIEEAVATTEGAGGTHFMETQTDVDFRNPSVKVIDGARAKNKRKPVAETKFGLSPNRFVVVKPYRGTTYVHIRDYREVTRDGIVSHQPSRHGVVLTPDQWVAVKKLIPAIDVAIEQYVISQTTDPASTDV